MLELYENIRNIRIERGLSQEELAKKTGYTDRSSIAKIEKGNVDLPQSKIMLFAKALGVTPGSLMGNVNPDTITVPNSPELHALVDAAKDCKPEEIKSAVAFLKTIKNHMA